MELVHVYRGDYLESIHSGHIVVVKDKKIIASYGDPNKRTFWRSSAKPFQVIPFIEAGGLEAFSINEKELALMTSSHGGEVVHVNTVRSILGKLSLGEDSLDCGPARPMFTGAYVDLLKTGQDYGPCNNPCSGKHTSMLGLALIKGINLHNYIDKDHEIQKIMLDVVKKYTEHDDIHIAIDGCGVPVFELPLTNMAIAYEKLASPELKIIADAMTKNPFYVAGSKRLDTILMEETKGRILAKLGAESVYCMTILESRTAIAVKIDDGSYRALDALIPDLLLKHNFISLEEHLAINMRLDLKILNHRQNLVGHYKSLI